MPSGKKCPDCKLCLDIVFILPRRFFHCFLCLKYYDIVDGNLVQVIPDEVLKKHMDLIIEQEKRTIVNERFP
jgi:hypothetical protein